MYNDLLISEVALHDAIRWCNYILATGPFSADGQMIDFDRQTPNEWIEALPHNVSRLISERAERLRCSDAKNLPARSIPGSILVFYPYRSMHDGLAQAESNGLFDAHGCPLHDFWIGLSSNPDIRLLSWIPYPLLDLIESVMKVDAAKSLAWMQ